MSSIWVYVADQTTKSLFCFSSKWILAATGLERWCVIQSIWALNMLRLYGVSEGLHSSRVLKKWAHLVKMWGPNLPSCLSVLLVGPGEIWRPNVILCMLDYGRFFRSLFHHHAHAWGLLPETRLKLDTSGLRPPQYLFQRAMQLSTILQYVFQE